MKHSHLCFHALTLLLLILLIPSVSAQAPAQAIEIHPRIGVSVDDAERAYFNLFRTWPAGEVVASRMTDGSIQFTLTGSDAHQITLPESARSSVATYVDRYEDAAFLRDSLDWRHVSKVGRFGNRYRPSAPATYAGMDGSRKTVTLLRTSESRLAVLDGTEDYQWDMVRSTVRQVDAAALARVERGRSWVVVTNRAFFGIGALLGTMGGGLSPEIVGVPRLPDILGVAAVTASSFAIFRWAESPRKFSVSGDADRFASAAVDLEQHAAFVPGMSPPELTEAQIDRLDPLLGPSGSERAPRWTPGRYLTIGSEFLFSLSEFDSFIGTGFGLQAPDRRHFPFLRVALSQDHSRRLGYGAEVYLALPTAADDNEIDYAGQLVAVHGDWYASRPDYLTFSNRWSASVGIGVIAGRMQSRARVSFSDQIIALDPGLRGVDHIGQSSTTAAGQIRFAAGYALNELSLIEFRVTANVPSVSLDTKERNVAGSTLYKLDEANLPIGVSLSFKKRLTKHATRAR